MLLSPKRLGVRSRAITITFLVRLCLFPTVYFCQLCLFWALSFGRIIIYLLYVYFIVSFNALASSWRILWMTGTHRLAR